MLDGDTAGIRAATRLIDLALPMLEAGQGLRFVILPEGMDPDDLLRLRGRDAMAALLDEAQPMVNLLWRREIEGRVFDSPERRAALDKSLRETLKTIRDGSIRAHYGAEVDASFLASYGWVDLVGAHGPRRAPGLRLGFLLLGARTRYPPHAHAAEEHYVPLSGAALWTRGRSPPALQRPGALIHHPPWAPHATETTDEPLLALYVWRGARLNAGPRWEV